MILKVERALKMAADQPSQSEVNALRALMIAMLERFVASKSSPHDEMLMLHAQTRSALKAILEAREDINAEEVVDDIFTHADHALAQSRPTRRR